MGMAGASVLPFLKAILASASGSDTIVVVTGQTINSLDLHRSGTSRASYQVGVNCYDRLVSFGTKEAIGGGFSYDYSVIEPELAESWEISADGLTMTFKLKPNRDVLGRPQGDRRGCEMVLRPRGFGRWFPRSR